MTCGSGMDIETAHIRFWHWSRNAITTGYDNAALSYQAMINLIALALWLEAGYSSTRRPERSAPPAPQGAQQDLTPDTGHEVSGRPEIPGHPVTSPLLARSAACPGKPSTEPRCGARAGASPTLRPGVGVVCRGACAAGTT